MSTSETVISDGFELVGDKKSVTNPPKKKSRGCQLYTKAQKKSQPAELEVGENSDNLVKNMTSKMEPSDVPVLASVKTALGNGIISDEMCANAYDKMVAAGVVKNPVPSLSNENKTSAKKTNSKKNFNAKHERKMRDLETQMFNQSLKLANNTPVHGVGYVDETPNHNFGHVKNAPTENFIPVKFSRRYKNIKNTKNHIERKFNPSKYSHKNHVRISDVDHKVKLYSDSDTPGGLIRGSNIDPDDPLRNFAAMNLAREGFDVLEEARILAGDVADPPQSHAPPLISLKLRGRKTWSISIDATNMNNIKVDLR
jgi:hypothetical protein